MGFIDNEELVILRNLAALGIALSWDDDDLIFSKKDLSIVKENAMLIEPTTINDDIDN